MCVVTVTCVCSGGRSTPSWRTRSGAWSRSCRPTWFGLCACCSRPRLVTSPPSCSRHTSRRCQVRTPPPRPPGTSPGRTRSLRLFLSVSRRPSRVPSGELPAEAASHRCHAAAGASGSFHGRVSAPASGPVQQLRPLPPAEQPEKLSADSGGGEGRRSAHRRGYCVRMDRW